MIAGAVLVIDAVSNIYLGKLLVEQSRLLNQSTMVLRAAINSVTALADKVAQLCEKDNPHGQH